jgi:hypothetical protein
MSLSSSFLREEKSVRPATPLNEYRHVEGLGTGEGPLTIFA